MMRSRLAVKIGKLRMKNPVMAASGTFGEEYGELLDIGKFGALVTKTVTLKARAGNPPPRLVETPSGMLNSIGLENKGLRDFIKTKLPRLASFGTPVIASIAGDSEEEYAELARVLTKTRKIAAIELNLSCPNVKHGGRRHLIAQDAKDTYEAIKAVRRATGLTLIAKLSPNVTDITAIARAAQDAGADALSLINTLTGMAVDIGTRRPVLGNNTGGLSGPAIKPVALRMVRETYKAVRIPIIGIGGIMDWKDAVEFMLCGALSVQTGTANFVNPNTAIEIIDGLKKYMDKNKIGSVTGIIGMLDEK